MTTLTNYHGLEILQGTPPLSPPVPPGAGGYAISKNFANLVDWHPLSQWAQTGNPTASNNQSQNYFAGSLWLNSSTGDLFLCVNSTSTTAVWQQVILAPISQGTGNAINPNTNSMVIGSDCIAGNGFAAIRSISGDTVTLDSPGFAATPTVGDSLLYSDQNGHVINTAVVTATSATTFTVTAGSLSGMANGYICDTSLSTAQYPSIAVGSGAVATGQYALAVGNFAIATGSNSVSFGGQASGSYSLAMGLSGSSAGGTCAIAIGNSQIANGSYSTALGSFCTADGDFSVAVGSWCMASSGGISLGDSCDAAGAVAVALGSANDAEGSYSVAMGREAFSPLYGQNSFSSGSFANPGDAQISTFIVRNTTTNTTPTNLYLDGSSTGMVLPANQTAWRFTADVAAYDSTTNLSGSWEIKGCVKLNNSGTYSLVGTPTTTSWLDNSFTGTATVTASSGFQVQVTGISTDAIRWVAKVTVVQVSFGVPI